MQRLSPHLRRKRRPLSRHHMMLSLNHWQRRGMRGKENRIDELTLSLKDLEHKEKNLKISNERKKKMN